MTGHEHIRFVIEAGWAMVVIALIAWAMMWG